MNPNEAFRRKKQTGNWIIGRSSVIMICCVCGHKTIVSKSRWTDMLEEIKCNNCGRTEGWDEM